MRVCILMSGRPSLYQTALRLLKKQLSPLGQEELELHALFWNPVSTHHQQELRNVFTVRNLWAADPADFSAVKFGRKHDETNAGNFLSMLAGRQLLLDQMIANSNFNAAHYDYFLYTRPDVCLNDGITTEAFAELLATIKEKKSVFVPQSGNWRGGVNDQFAITDFAVMQVYLSLFNHLQEYYVRDRIPLHPELMLQHHLATNQIQVEKLSCDNVIFRSEYKFGIG